jgi:selenocysteine lyase/cysteine desulfurase
MMGTNNGAVFKGYRAALQFIERIGADRIFARIQELAKFTYESALKLPKVHMLTPEDTRMYAGMVTFRIDGVDLRKLGPLFRRHNIWVVPGSNSLRVSTHIHTRIADLERFFTVLREGLAA